MSCRGGGEGVEGGDRLGEREMGRKRRKREGMKERERENKHQQGTRQWRKEMRDRTGRGREWERNAEGRGKV